MYEGGHCLIGVGPPLGFVTHSDRGDRFLPLLPETTSQLLLYPEHFDA